MAFVGMHSDPGGLEAGLLEGGHQVPLLFRPVADIGVNGEYQVLLLPAALEQAGQILDDYLSSYREYLPQFWK